MSLIGLRKRSNLCKICLHFDEKTLNEITLDILLNRRTYDQIMKYYSPLLPNNVAKLSAMNINNHRKHTDPTIIADDVLKRAGKSNKPEDIISKLYSERFKEKIDKQKVLEETYRERINNLFFLQTLINEKQDKLMTLKADPASGELLIKRLETSVKEEILEVDKILESLQSVVIKDNNSDKGIGEGNVYITQNFVNLFQNHLKGFMDEIVPRILLDYFADNTQKGKDLVLFLSQTMDKHIMPALSETEKLPQKIN
jgi:hypothetical protein